MTSVLVGMSGGLDSSFAAYLLKKKGLDVHGIFFRMTGEIDHAKQKKVSDICELLDIPLVIEDCSRIFQKAVIKPFVESYLKGFTPNPCVICNVEVKFDLLFRYADQNAIDLVGSGHYARLSVGLHGSHFLLRGMDPLKDQSYMLYRLKNEWFPKLIFPLGSVQKSEIKVVSENIFGELLKNDSESQDICFLQGMALRDLLQDKADSTYDNTGPIVDTRGNILGEHRGVYLYTVGQRRGLALQGGPWFVISLDPLNKMVIVGKENELFPSIINCSSPVWHGKVSVGDELFAQHRYRTRPVRIRIISIEGDQFIIEALEPMKAPAPGQSLVLYSQDKVVGGGIILSTREVFKCQR